MSRAGTTIVYLVLALLALVLIALLALPVWTGVQARTVYEQAVADFNTQAAPMMRLETARYDKGWLTSRVETLVHHTEMPFSLKFTHDVRHGPLNLPGLVNAEPVLMLARLDGMLSPGEGPGGQTMVMARGDSFVGFNGDTQSHWLLEPQLAAMLGTDGQPVWARVDYRAAGGDLSFQAQLPELEMSNPQGDYRLSDLRFRLDMRPAQGGKFSVGSYGMSLKYLRAGGLADMVAVEDLRIRARATERAGKVDTEMAVSFEQVDSPAGVIGPARFILQLNNLDAAALEAYAEMQDELLQGMDPMLDQQAMAAQLMPQLMGVLPEVFSQAELRIPTLYVATTDGALNGKATVVVPPLNAEAMAVPMAVLTSLNLDAQVAIDEAMMRTEMERALRTRLMNARAAELGEGGALLREEIDEDAASQTDAQLSVLTSQGYLQLDGGVYRARVTMEGGNILVNGNPINPTALMPGAGAPMQ